MNYRFFQVKKKMPNFCLHESVMRRIPNWPKALLTRWQSNRLSGKKWMKALPVLVGNLENLGKSTEAEFLAIGEKLAGFHRHAAEISKTSTTVGQRMSGEEITTVIHGFREVVARIEHLQGESRQHAATLAEVLQTLARLNRQLSSFRETVRTLRVLCVSIRIEGARFGERDIGFNGLADEVEKLAVVIEEKTSHLLKRSESLGLAIGEVLVRVSELETTRHAQAEVILGKTMASLQALSAKHASSATAVQGISNRYEAISRNIGEIVSSIQIHDITRQRIEHAAEGLDGILGQKPNLLTVKPGEATGEQATKSDTRESGDGFWRHWPRRERHADRAGNDLPMVSDICVIQAAQLRHARDLLVAEVENILENLSQIAGHVMEMSREMDGIAGTEQAAGQSSLSEIETGFSTVMSALSAYGVANRELSSVMEAVGGTLEDMSAYSGDIEGIGAQIRLIALNAIVKASHMDLEGASLAILAEAVHKLSVETCERTGTVGETLRLVLSASESLGAGTVENGDGSGAEVARLSETLKALLNSLHGVNQDVGAQLTRVNEEGRQLSEGIQQTISGVSVHRRVGEALSKVILELEGIIGRFSLHRPAEVEAQATERIRALEAAYTMQGERHVHRTVIAGKSSTGGKTTPSLPDRPIPEKAEAAGEPDGKANDEPESDLGDNVELF